MIGKAVVGKEDEILCIMFQELRYSGGNAQNATGGSERLEIKIQVQETFTRGTN